MALSYVFDTPRFYMRHFSLNDKANLFRLDSDAEVHRFLGNQPLKEISETESILTYIRQQYLENGVGRLAIIDKKTNEFIGWTGLKLVKESINDHVDYYDLGYRLIRQYWGKGIATETAFGVLEYGFQSLGLDNIHAMVDCENIASSKVLLKVGFQQKNSFDFDNICHHWYEINKDPFLEKVNKSSL